MASREEILETFSTNLRVERARKHYSQEYLAEKAEISQEYLARLETKKYNPTLVIVVKLAEALEVSLDTLMPSNEFLK